MAGRSVTVYLTPWGMLPKVTASPWHRVKVRPFPLKSKEVGPSMEPFARVMV